MSGLGGASNYPPGCSGPPAANEPHPWSEELWGLLEDAGLEEGFVNTVVKHFDEALEEDNIKILDVESLLRVASLCREIGRESDSRGYYAIFWSSGTASSVTGATSFVDCMVKVANIIYGGYLTEKAGIVENLLYDVQGKHGVDENLFNKAYEILTRVNYCYVSQAEAEGKSNRIITYVDGYNRGYEAGKAGHPPCPIVTAVNNE